MGSVHALAYHIFNTKWHSYLAKVNTKVHLITVILKTIFDIFIDCTLKHLMLCSNYGKSILIPIALDFAAFPFILYSPIKSDSSKLFT